MAFSIKKLIAKAPIKSLDVTSRHCVDFEREFYEIKYPVITLKHNSFDLNFICDTGASVNLINAELIGHPVYEYLGQSYEYPLDIKYKVLDPSTIGFSDTPSIQGMVDKENSYNCDLISISMGFRQHSIKDIKFLTAPITHMLSNFNIAPDRYIIHGFLGAEFLDKHRVILDYESKKLYLKI